MYVCGMVEGEMSDEGGGKSASGWRIGSALAGRGVTLRRTVLDVCNMLTCARRYQYVEQVLLLGCRATVNSAVPLSPLPHRNCGDSGVR